MKKKLIITVGALLLAVAAALINVNQKKDDIDGLFNANVEALSQDENNYSEKIWYRFDREDGGFNCTKGGDRDCV